MTNANNLIFAGAFLLFAGVLIGHLSGRVGLPLLLVFLLVGMLAGEDGPGGIAFDDFELAFLVGNLALAIILLDGGLRTRETVFRIALGPAFALASVGVVVTAAVVGAAAVWLLGWDWRFGLLLGAIVGSTDAAAVFAILRASSVRLNDRLAATLEIESGVNDPMAVFLTVALIELVLRASEPGPALVGSLVLQLGLGALAGAVFGVAFTWLLRRILLSEGLYALLIASGGLLAFSLTNQLGGSGFLAVYLVGLIVGNRSASADEDVLRAMDGLAWLSQAGMFLLLGLLVTPSQLAAFVLPALAMAAVLMLAARPLAVVLCLAPFRFRPREIGFVAWVGLRGAVPIVLAVFPVIAGVAGAAQLFNIAFFVVLVSLLVQGSSVALAARTLRVGVPPRAEPLSRVAIAGSADAPRGGYEFAQYAVGSGSVAEGAAPASLVLPRGVAVAAAFRSGAPLPLDRSALAAGDLLCLIGPAEGLDAVAERLGAVASQAELSRAAVFGDFILDAHQPLGAVARFYGVRLEDESLATRSVRDVLEERLHRRAVAGDAVAFGSIELTVREVRDGRIEQVGLKLR